MGDQNYLLTPGFQSSRGDQIIPSLCSLLKKMKDLEQPPISKPERRDIGTNPDYSQSESSKDEKKELEDKLIRQMRLKLLSAQMHTISCLLLKKYPKSTRNVRTNTEEAMFPMPQAATSTKVFDDLDNIPVRLIPIDMKYGLADDVKESGYFASSSSSITDQIHLNEDQKHSSERMEQLMPVVPKSRTSSFAHSIEMKQSVSKHHHFHLKLSKVPFILGTVRNNCSTTASHSLIANVQTIISTLKRHNNLCTPAQIPTPQRCSTPRTQRKQNYVSNLKNLGKEFNMLTLQQKKLEEQLFENKNRPEKKIIYERYKNISDLLQTKAKEIVGCHAQSESERLLSAKTKLKKRPSSEPFFIPRWE